MPVGGFGSRRSRAQLRGLLMGVIGLLIFLLLLSSSSSSHSSTAVPKASAKFPKRPPPPKEVAVQEPEKAAEITQNVSKDPQEPSVSPETLKKLKTLSARARALSFSLPDDFAELRVRSKVFMDLFSAVVPNKAYEKMNLKYTDWQEIQSGLDALEGLMYPMSPEKYPFGTRSLYEGFKGRGIVMSTGNWHFR